MKQEHQKVEIYRKFASLFIPQEYLKSLASFCWKNYQQEPPEKLKERYAGMPRQIIDVIWWNETTFRDTEGGWILLFFDSMMRSQNCGKILTDLGLLPQPPIGGHQIKIIEETLYPTILKALAIASADIECLQKSDKQIDNFNVVSVI